MRRLVNKKFSFTGYRFATSLNCHAAISTLFGDYLFPSADKGMIKAGAYIKSNLNANWNKISFFVW
jgi:hypothetical protein